MVDVGRSFEEEGEDGGEDETPAKDGVAVRRLCGVGHKTTVVVIQLNNRVEAVAIVAVAVVVVVVVVVIQVLWWLPLRWWRWWRLLWR